jgi:hypothetical protein
MPTTILVFEKLGNIKETTVKSLDEAELCKKAGFKSVDGFKCYAEWNIESLNDKKYSICLYGKTTGRANQENKYEFPPPVDTTLFFGSCVAINKDGDLTEEEWDVVYDHLYGGFDELGEEEDASEEEDEEDELPRTKSGYVKDGFIVDDDVEDEDEDEDEDENDASEDEDEEEEDDEPPKKSAKKRQSKAAPKTKAKASGKSKAKPADSVFRSVENYLGCTSELSEEEYVE